MKLIPLLTLCCILQVSAMTGFAQRINLEAKSISLVQALRTINQQSGYDFVYDHDLLRKYPAVAANLKDANVQTALTQLLAGTDLTYNIDGGIIAIRPKSATASLNFVNNSTQQSITLRGRVTNNSGEPLQYVNVSATRAQGTAGQLTAGQTDRNGEFTLSNVAANGEIMFSMLGYRTITQPINNRTNIAVTLLQAQEKLEDVVITGIYERRADSYTGSVQTITKEELKKVGSVNVFQALKNIAPSMVLDNFEMGSNPNTMPELQIRGTSTFPADLTATEGLKGNYLKNPNEPLFIVDGFEASIERVFDLDINRIESVTILKDAASKALYGSRAGNGVIVIETTRVPAERPLISYNTSVDIELPDLTAYNLTNAEQKLQAELIDGMYTGSRTAFDPPATELQLQQIYNTRKKLIMEGLDTYWLAKPLRDGVGQRHALSAELGGDNLRIIGDISYRNINGIMRGSDRQTLTGSMSTSYRLKGFLFRNITTFVSNQSSESPYGNFGDYVKMNPYWRAELPDGTIPFYAEGGMIGAILGASSIPVTNPLYDSNINSVLDNSYSNFINNFYLEWTIIPGLRATSRIGLDLKKSRADEFYPSSHTRFDDTNFGWLTIDSDNPVGLGPSYKGSYQMNNGQSLGITGDLNVNYSKEIGKNYYFANAGFNVGQRTFGELLYNVYGFPGDQMDHISFGRTFLSNTRPEGVDGINRDIGVLASASYMWDERFLSDFTFRSNASSLFGADKRWAHFYSVGLGWNLHNESWLNQLNWMQQLRVRGSVGTTGNQNFNTNYSIATYEYQLNRYYQGLAGVQLLSMVNEDLQWESMLDYNAGLDARLGAFSLRFDYYQRFTENLLTDVTLPNSTGFGEVKDNLGKVKNSGIEAFSSYRLWSNGANFISINASIETNDNKIVELSDAMRGYNARMDEQAAYRGNSKPVKRYYDGMSMNTIWAVPSLGIDPATGQEIYVDQEGNTTYIWSANDLVAAGVERSSYQGTFGFSAEYKRVGISVTGRYLGGGQLYNQTLVDRVENVDMRYNVDARVLSGRWLTPGQPALFKRLGEFTRPVDEETTTVTAEDEKTRATTRFVQDRRELDIAAVNVYYDFNPAMIQRMRMSRLRLAFNMNEIAKFSSIQIERGLSYPFARTMSFSLMATF